MTKRDAAFNRILDEGLGAAVDQCETVVVEHDIEDVGGNQFSHQGNITCRNPKMSNNTRVAQFNQRLDRPVRCQRFGRGQVELRVM